MKSKSFKLIIWFYRLTGITFGGISFGKNGTLIKSKFWYHFGTFGCCVHITTLLIITGIVFMNEFIQMSINSQFTIVKLVLLTWHIIRFVTITTITITNQKYGFKIIKILLKYSMTRLSKLKIIKIIWIIHVLICFTKLTYDLILSNHLMEFIINIYYNIMVIPLIYSISFISWMITINFTENIKIIRSRLNHDASHSIKTNYLIEANNFMTINFRKINKIDQYLAFGFITFAIGIMFCILQFVYLAVFTKIYNYSFYNILPLHCQVFIQLILNCFINGMIFDETQKLIYDLDNININVQNRKLFRALIFFRTSIRQIKYGFTIGGFAQ